MCGLRREWRFFMRNTIAAASLVGVTLIWGWTFTIVKGAVHQYDVLSFLFWRFLIAAVIFAYWSVRAVSFRLWTDGCVAGFLLATAYLLQTIGLKEPLHNSPVLYGTF